MNSATVEDWPPHVDREQLEREVREEWEIPTVGFIDLLEANPMLHKPVIHGILRQGETMNIIAASKTGKSFMAGGLAWSVLTGTPWLGHEVDQGGVLVIDNELHAATIASRLYRIATDMMIDYRDYGEDLQVASLRGLNVPITHFEDRLPNVDPERCKLVIVDALYRSLPNGTNENSNGEMMAIYNELDRLAKLWGVAIVVIHHASKGEQSQKSVVDVGSGAGAISRAADTHLTIRPHEDEELCVLEARTRSFESPPPRSVKFRWPLWSLESTEAKLKTPTSKGAERQKADDDEADEAVLDVLTGTEFIAPAKVRRSTGMGESRVNRAIARLRKAERIEFQEIENPRNKKETIEVFRAV